MGKLLRHKGVSHRTFTVTAALVVFVTTYALILPAITKTTTTYCGKEEHTHTETCYKTEKVLSCDKKESDGHVHSKDCYKTVKELVCGQEESDGHVHTDSCYETEQVLTCTNDDPDHVHTDGCYTEQKTLVCGKEEGEGAHHHTDACYKETKELVCGKEEGQGAHKHSDKCYSEKKVLTCNKKEHKHTTSCYANPSADTETSGSWTNTFKNAKLTGNWSEDVITIAKTQLGYHESTKNYVLDEKGKKKGYTRYGAWYGCTYGDWCAMFCSFCINYAQIPTTEAAAEKVETEECIYVPIGAGCQAWIESLNTKEAPYYYAVNDKNGYKLLNGKDSICWNDPEEELEAWKEKHKDDGTDLENVDITDVCEKYHPQAGDLIFFNWDSEADADHVGLIESVDYAKDGTVSKIHTIEGNSSDSVKENSYTPDNRYIMGFANLPENPEAETEEAENPDVEDIAEDSAEISEKEADEIIDKTATKNADKLTNENDAEEDGTDETAAEETSSAITEETSSEITEETSSEITGETSSEIVDETASDVTDETESETEESEASEEETAYQMTQTVEGKDYTVTVIYGLDAQIPAEAELQASEYKESSSTYKERYAEAAQLYGWDSNTEFEADFRLFNIGFYVDGEEIEPAADVKVIITYSDAELPGDTNYQVTHYTDDEPEIMDANTSVDEGETVIDFSTDSFSDYSTSKPVGAAKSEDNLVANFTFADGALTDESGKAQALAYGGTDYGKHTTLDPDATDTYTYKARNYYRVRYTIGTYQYIDNDTSYKHYMYVTNKSSGSLLSGYNQVSFDFYMNACAKSSTYSKTGDTDNGWLVFVDSDGTSQTAGSGNYLGLYIDGDAKTLTAVSCVDGNVSTAAVSSTYDETPVHVRLEFTETQIVLSVYTASTTASNNGNLIGTQTVSTSNDITKILTNTSILQFCKGNIGDGEYYNGYIDTFKVYATNTKGEETEEEPEETADGYPDCALPGTVSVNHQLFYNLDGSGDTITGLEGVVYTLYSKNSDGTWTTLYSFPTGDDLQVDLGSLNPGTYKLEQSYVPEGYVVNSDYKEFTVKSGEYTNIGIFYAYKEGDNEKSSDKTAQVVDYFNRTYQVDLSAYSKGYTYDFDVKDYFVVVDQSNSMLFPAQLTAATLKDGSSTLTLSNSNGSQNEKNCEAKLDTSKVYYIIADESKTSTVYAIYYDSTHGGWCFQDAAYYAKAQFNSRGIHTDLAAEYDSSGNLLTIGYARSDLTTYSGSYTTNGVKYTYTGGASITALASTLSGDCGTSKAYTVYEGSTYDRLHEVQEAVSLFAEQLAALTPDSTLTIETFDMNVETCTTHTLNPAGVKDIIDTVNTMATAGGTRQDRALAHLLGTNTEGRNNSGCTKTHLTKGNDDIVILITDGAPVTSNADNSSGDTASIAKVTTAGNNVTATGATLITVGLSTKNVVGGSDMLKDIASSTTYTDSGKWFFDATAAGDLTNIMVKNILFKQGTKRALEQEADIEDVISDSFYPINPADNTPLTDGTTIDLDGNVVTDTTGISYGTVHYNSETKEWSVTWSDQTLGDGTTTESTTTDDTTSGDTSTEETTTTTTTYTWTSSGTVLDTSQTYYMNAAYELIGTTLPTTQQTANNSTNIAAVTYDSSTEKWTAKWYKWRTESLSYTASTGSLKDTDVTTYVTKGTETTSTGTTDTGSTDTGTTTTTSSKWHGRIYLKAKEDFIGGNTINTNKSADITFLKSTTTDEGETTKTETNTTIELETPTVNVRLLPFKGYESEETVFLGDDVTDIKEKLETLLEKTVFEKIQTDTAATTQNYKTGALDDDDSYINGDTSTTFSIPYALANHATISDILDGDSDGDGVKNWEELVNGDSITIDYTYDDDSSNGAVGFFTLSLTKKDEDSDYEDHIAAKIGYDVEDYTLSVTYTAYRITGDDTDLITREENVHNGENGPGTEVGSVETTLGEGLGTETVDEIHYVHVIDGKIYLTKTIDESLKDDNNEQVFSFNIYTSDPREDLPGEVYSTASVTIKAGETSGTVCIDHLPRDTYYVKECIGSGYITSGASVETQYTNCNTDEFSYTYELQDVEEDDGKTNKATTKTDYVLVFDIGTNPASKTEKNPEANVILYNENAPVEEASAWNNSIIRYVYSKPFTSVSANTYSESGTTGTHTELVSTSTYACSTGTIISSDTSGDTYTVLTDTQESLDYAHKSYGVLTQDESDKDKWTVTWHTWTESGTTKTYDWPSGTIITEDTSGTYYVKSDYTEEQLKASHTKYGVLTQDESDPDKWTITWHSWTSKKVTTKTYSWSSGTLITEDTSGDQYVLETRTVAQLEAAHAKYGVLTQDESDPDKWTITWHSWTSSVGSSSDSSNNVTITLYQWLYSSNEGKVDKVITVPANKSVTITYTCDYSETSDKTAAYPCWWDGSTYRQDQAQKLTATAVSGATNTYQVTVTPTTNISIGYSFSYNVTGAYVSNTSTGETTYTENKPTEEEADPDMIPSKSTTETVYTENPTTEDDAVASMIPSQETTSYTESTETKDAVTSKIPTKTVTQEIEVEDPVDTDTKVLNKLSQGAGIITNIKTDTVVYMSVHKKWEDEPEEEEESSEITETEESSDTETGETAEASSETTETEESDKKKDSKHKKDDVYVVLYDKNGVAVTETVVIKNAEGEDEEIQVARMIHLSDANDWTDSFAFSSDNAEYNPIDDGYYVREVKGKPATKADDDSSTLFPAKLEGDDANTIYYVDVADNKEVISINDTRYGVYYSKSDDGKSWIITNATTYELPKSGGIGTTLYTSGGVILIILSLLCGFYLRRSRERRFE